MTTIDYTALPGLFAAAVPFAGFLGIEFAEVSPDSAVLRLADDPAKHNHIGTLHAGALFALAETASGLVMTAAFADKLAEVRPLAASAAVTYRRVARGDVTAVARIDGDVTAIRAALDAEGVVKFPVHVDLTDESGEIATVVTVDWHLKKSSP